MIRLAAISRFDLLQKDGVFDLALLGERLLAAHCESGLMASAWSSTSIELEAVPGPWHSDVIGDCTVTEVEVVDDVIAAGNYDRLTFARRCD